MSQYELIEDPLKQGCTNCVVCKLFGINVDPDVCDRFQKDNKLPDCYIADKTSMIYKENK